MSSVRHCSRSLHLASFKNKFTSSVFARSSFLCCASAVAQQAERAQRRRRSKSAGASTPPSDMYMPVPCSGWVSLGVPRRELSLCFTLPTGQSFRWRETVPDVEYTGGGQGPFPCMAARLHACTCAHTKLHLHLAEVCAHAAGQCDSTHSCSPSPWSCDRMRRGHWSAAGVHAAGGGGCSVPGAGKGPGS